MKRRELFRRSILGLAGTALAATSKGEPETAPPAEARKIDPEYDASKELARADWEPVFLSPHQNETLILLSDLIIPETDTPGAKAALANRYIDKLLAAEAPDVQRSFLNALAGIDGESLKRHGSAFLHLTSGQQVELLRLLAYPHRLVTWGDNRARFSGHDHFRLLKDWIARAFYSSEIGMEELGWEGGSFHEDFPGCEHPDSTHE